MGSDAAPSGRAVRLLLGVAVLPSLLGCGDPGVFDRAPDVTGRVDTADSARGPSLADPSDEYFVGMSLVGGASDPVVVRDGEKVSPADLRDGDEVEVWIEDGCAESFPVQCTVVALRVRS